jgi:CYTH domain-containing protein
MGIEIERKFLVKKDIWAQTIKKEKSLFRQGYILSDSQRTVRVRLTDTEAFLTIKGQSVGIARHEFEYSIPKEDAQHMLDNLCISELSKIRYFIPHDGHTWEVDEFLGQNEGLIVAEIELSSEDEPFSLPDWVDKDVTSEKKYTNSNLAVKPYQSW